MTSLMRGKGVMQANCLAQQFSVTSCTEENMPVNTDLSAAHTTDGSRNAVWRKAFVAAFPHTVPVLASFLILGMAYGVLMQTKGYGPLWSGLMSCIAFCGSMQFVAITLLTIPFDPVQAFVLSLLVNARHLFYALSMLEKYKGAGRLAPFMIYTLCDETFSICCTLEPPSGVSRRHFYFAISFLDYSYWVGGTLLGALAGNAIFFDTQGMDFALTALFLVLFLEQWKHPERRISAIIGVSASIICVLLFGPANFIIPAMVIILAALTCMRSRL